VLVNVQPPAMSGEVSNLLTAEEVMEQHLEAGRKVLAGARELLERAGVPFEADVAIGRPADAIVEHAQRCGADAIVMGASSHGKVRSLVLGSVVSNVAHSAPVPVTVVK
jgi:nucleotide-binding universal stress UspA family protein